MSYRSLTKSVLGSVSIHCDAAQTPTGFAEIVSDDFPRHSITFHFECRLPFRLMPFTLVASCPLGPGNM